jgi:hypothetical protein
MTHIRFALKKSHRPSENVSSAELCEFKMHTHARQENKNLGDKARTIERATPTFLISSRSQ